MLYVDLIVVMVAMCNIMFYKILPLSSGHRTNLTTRKRKTFSFEFSFLIFPLAAFMCILLYRWLFISYVNIFDILGYFLCHFAEQRQGELKSVYYGSFYPTWFATDFPHVENSKTRPNSSAQVILMAHLTRLLWMLLQIFQMLGNINSANVHSTHTQANDISVSAITARWIKFLCGFYKRVLSLEIVRHKTMSQIDRNIPSVWLDKICSIIPILNYLAYSCCGHLLCLIK